MAVDYEDDRFQKVESEKQEKLSELEQTYAGMIEKSDQVFQQQIDASKQWADQQSEIQKQQHDFAMQQIEQQKAQAQKDYTKQQSGAYVDWKKQSSGYGAEAEKMAAAGLKNTGFSESSQVSMYNTYQNRVAAAKQSLDQANLNFSNAMQTAILQNNAALAEIALQALQQQTELALQSFQYKNSLLLELEDKKTATENTYYARWLDVLDQINAEEALARSYSYSSGSSSVDWTDDDSVDWGEDNQEPVLTGAVGAVGKATNSNNPIKNFVKNLIDLFS